MNTKPQHSNDIASNANSLRVSLHNQNAPALDVSLQCQPGEMLALVGPSGSGKSTVLRAIAGLQEIDKGSIQCAGTTWLDTELRKNLKVQRRNVGMVFQHYALFPHKTVLDNVVLALRNTNSKQRKAQALMWLERTNMTGLESRKPAELSGGQKQRVALARALASNPSVLLLDEPFSAVDQQTRRKLYRELAKLRRGLDIPMILVTHDVGEVQQLADSMCLIHKGQTLQQGSVHNVITTPKSKTIAKLLGHQNLFSACVHSHEQHGTLYRLGEQEILQGESSNLGAESNVTLLIAPSAISIADPPSFVNTQRNQLKGVIRDAVSMGDEWSLTVHLNTITKSLRFRVPQFQLDAMHAVPGSTISVNIRSSGIFAISDDQ